MAICIALYDKSPTIIHYTVYGRWTAIDFMNALDESDEMAARYDAPAYHIVDFRPSEASINRILYHRPDYEKRLHSKTCTVLVGASRLLKTMLTVLISTGIDMDIHYAENLDDARAIIATHFENTYTPE